MQVDNRSPWASDSMPLWTDQRTLQPVLVIKTGFQWDALGHLHPIPVEDIPIETTERFYNDDPEQGSLAAAADMVPFKHGCELLIFGTAKAPSSGNAFNVEVQWFSEQQQRLWAKQLRVFGRHVWGKNLFGWMPSALEPVDYMPLRYEYAFGGQHEEKPEKTNPNNPVGRGQQVSVGAELPQIQQAPFITSRHQKPMPAGFGPLAAHWQPRFERYRQLDAEAAASGQCPYPWRLDRALYNCAPADQQFEQWPDTKGSLRLKHFAGEHPEQSVNLPNCQPIATLSDGREIELRWDTLIVDTDNCSLFQVWRGVVPVSLKDLLNAQVLVMDDVWSEIRSQASEVEPI